MKQRRSYLYTAFLISLIFFMAAGTMSAAEANANTKASQVAPTFSMTVNNDKPGLNQEIQIVIQGHRLADMYAYEVNLKYDKERLTFTRATSNISGFSVEPVLKEDRIKFGHTKTGSVPGDSGDLTLCTLTFTTKASGNATIALENVKLVDSKVDMVTQPATNQVSLTISNNQVVLKDIAGHWAEAYIRQAVQLGFVSGYEDSTFRPDRQVTRAEFATMFVQALQLPQVSAAVLPFKDLAHIPAWARTFVAAAFKQGIISGYDDNTFRADRLITRAEMTTMIARALPSETDMNAVPSFADTSEIPAWARPYTAAAVKAGLVKGRGNNLFVPNDHATRAEAVTLILALRNATIK